MYLYPDNLKAKAMLWLWALRDIGIIGIGLLISVFAASQTGLIFPIVITAVFAFLTIRHEDTSILDFIRYAAFFVNNKYLFSVIIKSSMECIGGQLSLVSIKGSLLN